MRPLVLAFTIVAALVAAPSAALAKGPLEGRVCGASGCAPTTQERAGGLFPQGGGAEPPATSAPFATIELDVFTAPGKTEELAYDYLPSLGLARPHDTRFVSDRWIALDSDSRRALDAAVRGVELRPATQFPRVAGVAVPQPAAGGGPAWWAIAGASLAGLALLVLLARYATSALKARPRASKSSN